MKPVAAFVIALFFAICCNAQNISISGKVIDSATAKPIANVSILVANSTIGTKTDVDGRFTLNNLPKGTTLIASCVGYKARQAVISIAGSEPLLFILAERNKELKEVTINAGDWQRNLTRFKDEFIGTTNSKEVSILNPDILNLRFNKDDNRLTANTEDFLEIQNNKLGYKLRFLVKDFWADYNTLKTHYAGQVVFVPLKGKASDERRWVKNRKDAYNGSFRHFLTSLYANALTNDGFKAFQFIRWANTARPPEKLINSKLASFQKAMGLNSDYKMVDSMLKWRRFKNLPAENDSLGRTFTATNLINLLPDSNARLDFVGSIYIVYLKKNVDKDLDNLFRFDNAAKNHQISALSIKDHTVPIIFNKDGQLLTRENLFFEGAWDSRIIDMLPSDYKP